RGRLHRALALDVQQSRPALAHRRETTLERRGQVRGPLDALAVAVDGLDDLLEPRRRCEVAQRETSRGLGTAGRVETEDPAPRRLPPLVVEDDGQERQAVRAFDEMTGDRLAEEVRAVADG